MDAPKCSACGAMNKTLLSCARCKITKYCDKTCQTAHWTGQHKKECKILARGGQPVDETAKPVVVQRSEAMMRYMLETVFGQGNSQPQEEALDQEPASKPEDVATGPKLMEKPFTALQQNTFLHNLPELTTYKLLIDCLRMRQEDIYAFGGDTMTGTIYNSEPSSVPAFRKFIAKAATAQVLPPWWKDSSVTDCLRFSATEAGFSLEGAQEKSDIQETWKDRYMPMKLRMLGKVVYGWVPFPESGDALELMVQAEAGKGHLLGGF